LRRKKQQETHSPYKSITDWFDKGNDIDLDMSYSDKVYNQTLNKIPVLAAFIDQHLPNIQQNEKYLWMEFILFGLAEHSKLSRNPLDSGFQFSDLVGNMFKGLS
jgi:magnesium chelatase subunit I